MQRLPSTVARQRTSRAHRPLPPSAGRLNVGAQRLLAEKRPLAGLPWASSDGAAAAVLLFYGYGRVHDPAALALWHRLLCTRLRLGAKVHAVPCRARSSSHHSAPCRPPAPCLRANPAVAPPQIKVAPEGINGTVSGSHEACAAYVHACITDCATAALLPDADAFKVRGATEKKMRIETIICNRSTCPSPPPFIHQWSPSDADNSLPETRVTVCDEIVPLGISPMALPASQGGALDRASRLAS